MKISKSIFFCLPLPPGINHCYRRYRKKTVLTDEAIIWKQCAGFKALAEKNKQGWEMVKKEKIVLEYTPFWKRPRDCDGVLKLLMDSFQGILYENDHWVLPRAIDFEFDKKNPRIEVRVYKKEE